MPAPSNGGRRRVVLKAVEPRSPPAPAQRFGGDTPAPLATLNWGKPDGEANLSPSIPGWLSGVPGSSSRPCNFTAARSNLSGRTSANSSSYSTRTSSEGLASRGWPSRAEEIALLDRAGEAAVC